MDEKLAQQLSDVAAAYMAIENKYFVEHDTCGILYDLRKAEDELYEITREQNLNNDPEFRRYIENLWDRNNALVAHIEGELKRLCSA